MSNEEFDREVDEELRREQMKKIWDQFGPWMIGLAVLIVAVTAGFKGWDYWTNLQSAKSSDRFLVASSLTADGKHDEALTALIALKADGYGGYPVLAGFRIAATKIALDDKAGAIAEFDTLATNSELSTLLRDFARVRAALLALDVEGGDAAIARVQDLIADSAYRHTAREIVVLAHYEDGSFKKAQEALDQLLLDSDTPAAVKQRAGLIADLVQGKIGSAGSN